MGQGKVTPPELQIVLYTDGRAQAEQAAQFLRAQDEVAHVHVNHNQNINTDL